MTGTVRTQIFTSFALTMFDCLYCTEKKEKKKVWVSMKLFFFLLKYIFVLAWRIYSFTRNSLAHYFFCLVSFFYSHFLLPRPFCFVLFFFPSRLDRRTFPSWIPPGGLRFFFFSSWTRGQCA